MKIEKKPATKEELIDVLKQLKKWEYRDEALKYAESGCKFNFVIYFRFGLLMPGETVDSYFSIVYFIDSGKMHGYWLDDKENGDYHCVDVNSSGIKGAFQDLKRHFADGSLSGKIVKKNNNKGCRIVDDRYEEYYDDDEECYDDDEECYDDDEKEYSGYYGALEKNYSLVHDLEESRESFCGIGTRKVKLRLNKHCDNPDVYYIRQLLELEDINIQAKKYRGDYKKKAYDRKERMIQELVNFCYENGNYVYGFSSADNYSTSALVYFELPDGVQISFHCNLSLEGRRMYTKEWDGKVNSTLPKLEKYINEHFGEYIADKKKVKK